MRTKRSRVQVESYAEWDTTDVPPPIVAHQHTDYELGGTRVKAKRSVYHTNPTLLHSKPASTNDNVPSTPIIEFLQPFNPSDPQHLVPDVLQLETTRRRTAGVRVSVI